MPAAAWDKTPSGMQYILSFHGLWPGGSEPNRNPDNIYNFLSF